MDTGKGGTDRGGAIIDMPSPAIGEAASLRNSAGEVAAKECFWDGERGLGVGGCSGVGDRVVNGLEASTEVVNEHGRGDRVLTRNVRVAVNCRDGNGVAGNVDGTGGFGLDKGEAEGRVSSNHDILTWRVDPGLLPSG